MSINRPILFSALFIGAVSGFQSYVTKGKIARILLGTYVLILALSLIDLIPGAHGIASAFALLAALYVGLTQMPWQSFIQAVQPASK